jgi:Zn-dependent peptidase ImmA (M78 family)
MVPKTSIPEDFARALSKRFRITTPVNLLQLTGKIGLEIREVEPDGFEGLLVCSKDKPVGIIAVNKNIREPGRKRYIVSHEIGHYILPGHGEIDCICKTHDIESWSKELPEEEIAANRFASELLMPLESINPILNDNWATIAAAKRVSNNFGVSLTAAAVRCIDLTDENCALIVSQESTIRWFKPSKYFESFVPVRRRVSDDSFAIKLFQQEEPSVLDGSVPSDAWLSGYITQRVERVWEDSIYLPFYRSVLTIITITKQS